MRNMLLAATAALALAAGQAQAAYVINAVESGGDVVLTGSGSINLAALSFLAFTASTGAVNPLTGFVGVGTGSLDVYSLAPTGVSFGTGGGSAATTATGGFVAISGPSGAGLAVPRGYQSGAALGISTAIFANTTFANLGMTPGSYVYSWGDRTANTFDTLTLNIGPQPAAVPAPAALSLLGLGLAGLLLARRRG